MEEGRYGFGPPRERISRRGDPLPPGPSPALSRLSREKIGLRNWRNNICLIVPPTSPKFTLATVSALTDDASIVEVGGSGAEI